MASKWSNLSRISGWGGPFDILTIAFLSWHNVEMQMKHILLGFRARTVNDLRVCQPESLLIEIDDVLQS